MSSTEAEYVSLSACYAQVLLMRTQLTDYGFHFDKIPMYCDSKAAIAISCNPVEHSRTKHIDVRYYFIKEKVEKCIVELFFVETEYQLNRIIKVQVSKILPKIEKIVNEQLKAEVLTRSSNSSKTSYVVAGPADNQPIAEASHHPKWFQQQKKPPTPNRAWNKTLPATHGRIQPYISDLAKQADSRSSFNELMDTPVDFLAFLMNRLKVDTLTPELLDGPTYELMKGSCKSLVELEFFLEEVYKVNAYQLNQNNPEGKQYPHKLLKPLPLIPNSQGCRVIPFDHFINNDLEYLCGGASIRKIIAVTELQIVEWHNYKHLDWITVRRDDDKFYKFKEGDFKRLRIQDIKDMLLLLVQGKLTNLTVEENFAFNDSLRMFTRSIVIQRHVKDIQLGFIYQNKDKQNRLMRIDELHKFSDGTLNDVRTALDDHLKGIWMMYLPQAIWRKSNKERAAAMIQAIDIQLKTRRIMQSLEKFVGGRLYEGDFRMLQQTI
uniref:Gag-Pol polyprotein n=1 Tax=Tanacetum cinerariifolium TaxID=118510 RepID=A0A6L2MTD9_TANCI|nr:Gag-Pol polyprotein [Tanacetum cinerariifolium]